LLSQNQNGTKLFNETSSTNTTSLMSLQSYMDKSVLSMKLLLPLLLLITLAGRGLSFAPHARTVTAGHQAIRASSVKTHPRIGRTIVPRHATLEPLGEEKDSLPGILSEKLLQRDLDSVIWYLPPILTGAAFMLYTSTARSFHRFIDWASGHAFQAADGGQFASELAQSALGGPVTFGISILFGTLVGLTISTLYTRQQNIHETLVSMSEKFRDLELCVEGFPEPYKRQCKTIVDTLCSSISKSFANGTFMTPAALKERKEEIRSLTLQLNSLSKEPDAPGMILGRAFDCVTSVNEKRASLISALSTTFSPAHYVNMVLLAFSMLFVFLLQTDNTAMQFLLDFQLAIAWALLIGVFSILGVVIYDLDTPFSGIFSSARDANLMVDSLRVYTDREDS
jgi:hypothetical protein